MILSDGEIKELIARERLLEHSDLDRARYCGYELRLGKIFLPESGEEVSLAPRTRRLAASLRHALARLLRAQPPSPPLAWTIAPSQTLIIKVKEVLNIPPYLCATYGQLNRLARQGLMIMNASIVEPGYHGPLSCLLVNFSSQKIRVVADQPIAKIYFQTVRGVPQKLQDTVAEGPYEEGLENTAMRLPKSFLDIGGVEERVTERMRAVIRRGVTFGGIVIAVLLLWSQLEPLASTWIWKRTGLLSNSKQVELEIQQVMLEQRQQLLRLEDSMRRSVADLEKEIAGLRQGARR